MIILRWIVIFAAVTSFSACAQSLRTESNESDLANHFSQLALSCIHKQYPNIIKHMATDSSQIKEPRELYPAFYGCFDWHSSVHGHWLLVRLLRVHPDLTNQTQIIKQLSQSFTSDNIAGELAYFNRPNTGTGFERPYGLAWFLQLTAELRQWNTPIANRWLQALKPLEEKIIDNLSTWLPKLAFPIRVGEHSQTAFAFGLILDWSRIANNKAMENLLIKKIKSFYLNDKNCPLAYEPSGQDFLSPCIAEADLVRRILNQDQYSRWISQFLPTIPLNGNGSWVVPAITTDKSDGKLAHLDGLNLSRAWMLEGIASGLPSDDNRRQAILSAANMHKKSGLNAINNELHYMGSHWLGSFATYLETERGLSL